MTITKEEAIQKIKDGLSFDDPLFDAFRDDREVVLEAVRCYGFNLEYVSKELQDDKELVFIACSVSGGAFQHASERLRGDKEVVLRSLQHEPLSSSIHPFSELERKVLMKFILRFSSLNIQELCKDKDPIEALEIAIRQEKFQSALQEKPAVKRKKTF